MDQKSIDKLVEASTAEAEVASAVWQAAREASEKSLSDDNESPAEVSEKSEASDANEGFEPDVRLHPRAVYLLCIIYFLSYMFLPKF